MKKINTRPPSPKLGMVSKPKMSKSTSIRFPRIKGVSNPLRITK